MARRPTQRRRLTGIPTNEPPADCLGRGLSSCIDSRPQSFEHIFEWVGSNKRYGSDVTYAAIAESVLRPKPISLSSTEIGSEIRDADPNNVVAWIPFRTEDSVQVEGRVIAYTDRACLVEFAERNGLTHRVWVWAGAVERKPPRDA